MRKAVRILSRIRIWLNIIRDGLKGLWRHKGMGFASVFSVMALLLMFGATLLLLLNVNIFLRDTQEKVGDINIFIKKQVSYEDQQSIDEFLKNNTEIDELTYYSKEDAYEVFKSTWKDEAYLLEGMQDAFQPYYVVILKDVNQSHKFVNEITELPGVEKVNYFQDLIDRIESISSTVRYVGAIVVAALVLISFFVISNTIKLTVHARESEIEVMRYVGASSGMIEGPFVIEGMLFGLIGAAIAFLIVYLGYRELYEAYNEWFYQLSSSHLVHPLPIRQELVIIFGVMGAGIGMLGSLFSLRKYRKV